MKFSFLSIIISLLIFGCYQSEEINISQSKKNKMRFNDWQIYTDTLNSDISDNEAINLDTSLWNSAEAIKFSCKEKYYLCRAKLPNWEYGNNCIHAGQNDYGITIFINNKKYYQAERRDEKGNLKHRGFNQNLIDLPEFKEGDYIIIKVFKIQDLNSILDSISIISPKDFILKIIKDNIINLIFISIFAVTGIFFLILSGYSRDKLLFLGIGVFIIPITLFCISNSYFFQLLMPNPLLYYHLDHLGYMSAPIGAILVIEQISVYNYRKILKVARYINLVFLTIVIVLVSIDTDFYLHLEDPHFVLLFFTLIVVQTLLLKNIKTNVFESKILIVGMGFVAVISTIEIAMFYYSTVNYYAYHLFYIQYGILCFIISLIVVVLYRSEQFYKIKELAVKRENELIKSEKDKQEYFTLSLIESQENERNRIALELHDGIGQNLLIIKNLIVLNIKNLGQNKFLESFEKQKILISNTIEEVRTISQNLRPQHLDQLGLTIAIETMVEKFSEVSDINFHVELDTIDKLIRKDKEINIYRIAQESINNVIKHSGASKVGIYIKKTDSKIVLRIKDNGRGILNNESKPKGIGLIGMQERAKILDASLRFESSPLNGTEMILELNY